MVTRQGYVYFKTSSSPINPSQCSLKFAFYKLKSLVDKRSDIRRNGIGISVVLTGMELMSQILTKLSFSFPVKRVS